MDPDVRAELRADGVAFGAEDAALLRAVGREGSLNAAAEALERSYSRAHKRLATLEGAFGHLVDRERGGEGGGGSRLTDAAEDLLARFDRLRGALDDAVATETTVLSGTVRGRTGDLATVETAAGEVRALCGTDAEAVAVAVDADAVTLQDPENAPPPDETSARNRFEGTVTAVDRGDALVRVAVDIGAGRPLAALVTGDSADRLGLRAGRDVVATVKATATRATRR